MKLGTAPVVVLVALCIGCSSEANIARVAPAGLGAYWELSYWERPVLVETPPKPGDPEGSMDNWEVEVFGLTRRGWGASMPWSWFTAGAVYTYFVDWHGPRGQWGCSVLDARRPVAGMLSRPDLGLGRADAFGASTRPACQDRLREVREALIARDSSSGRS